MAVFHKKDSLEALNEKREAGKKNQKNKQDEISELQDAIIELAAIVDSLATANAKEDNSNG